MTSDYKPDICIYHGDCLDGFTAAWAIHRRWPACEFRPGWYGKPLPVENVGGKHVLFVDFSGPHDDLQFLAGRASSVVVLDHHKTAQADLECFVADGFAISQCVEALAERQRLGKLPIVAFFDMERSGAAMAWELSMHPLSSAGANAVPDIVLYVEDRDLWRFRYKDVTRAVCAALQSYPMNFELWDQWRWSVNDLLSEGMAILRANRMTVAKLLVDTRWQRVCGFTVPSANVPYQFASDAGNALLERYPDAPFAATFFARGDGNIQWSLRSDDSRQDVSAIAKGFGGGGHRNAAGFVQIVAPLAVFGEV